MPRSTIERVSPRLALALALCAALPVVLHQLVAARVAEAATAMSDRIGRPTTIEFIEVGLLGSVTFHGVDVPGIARVHSLEARLVPSSSSRLPVRVAEVVVAEPELFLKVSADGTSNFSRLLARARARGHGASSAHALDTRAAPSALPAIRVARGRVRVRTMEGVDLTADNVAVFGGSGHALRVTAGPVLASTSEPVAISVSFPQMAADIDAKSARIERLFAPGGVAEVAGYSITRLAASMGIEAQVEVRGRVGNGALEYRREASSEHVVFDGVPGGLFSAFVPEGVELGAATLGGTIARRGEDVRVRVDVADLGLRHRLLATEPVVIDASVTAETSMARPTAATLELNIGDAEIRGRVAVDRLSPPQFEAELRLARIGCHELLAAVPEPLRRSLRGIHLGGEVAATAELRIGGDFDPVLRWDTDGECTVRAEPPLASPERIRAAFDHHVSGRVIRVGDGPDYEALSELPAYVPAAFVAAEDSGFWHHRGFDWKQVARSFAANLTQPGVLRGGSTISQQLVKNVYLSHERTLARKLQEAIITWRVEARLDKELILDRYINVIELGPDIYGISEAASFWFDVGAPHLSPAQVALLAALTRAPSTESRRLLSLRRVPPDLRARVDEILLGMKHGGYIDHADYEDALAEAIEIRAGASRTAALKSQ